MRKRKRKRNGGEETKGRKGRRKLGGRAGKGIK